MYKDSYTAHHTWHAAWLVVNRVELQRVYLNDRRRVVFQFDNVGDKAYDLSTRWFKDGASCVANVPEYMRAYRAIIHAFDDARNGSETDGYDFYQAAE